MNRNLSKLFEYEEFELLNRLRTGDEGAFEILFHRYKNRIKGFVHKTLPSHISSDSVVQKVFIKIWINHEKIDPSKNFSSFIFTISKNLVLDELKSAMSKKLMYTENHVLDEILPGQEDMANREKELESIIQQGIGKLPQRRRQIFSLSRLEGLSYKQIAEKLSISENTVDTQIRKSLQFLRQEFSNIF